MLADLLGYYEDAYLLFQVKSASTALSENTTQSPKVYAIDPGLALANTRAGISDLGQRLEDAVYLELRRRTRGTREGSIATLQTRAHGYEVDFFVGDLLSGVPHNLYQVCVNVDDPKTLARETRALWEAMAEHGLDHGTLIVADGPNKRYEQDERVIEQVGAWRWLLG